MFWLVWAQCALLLHVFDYNRVFEMPAVPIVYVVLSPVLITSALVCYFKTMWLASLGSYCSSCCKEKSSTSSASEQLPLLHTQAALHDDAPAAPN
jgi:hypothetical protein